VRKNIVNQKVGVHEKKIYMDKGKLIKHLGYKLSRSEH